MVDVPKVLEVNCETREQVYRNATAEEIASAERSRIALEEEQVRVDAARAAEEADLQSARTKLAALGLTEAEVAALVR